MKAFSFRLVMLVIFEALFFMAKGLVAHPKEDTASQTFVQRVSKGLVLDFSDKNPASTY